jgi:hypothetical protein
MPRTTKDKRGQRVRKGKKKKNIDVKESSHY